MLTKFRKELDRVISVTASPFVLIKVSPNVITIFSLVLAMFALLSSFYGYVLLSFTLILLSGYFDVIDGYVARKLGKVTKVGSFLDSTIDKINEILFICALYFIGVNPIILILFLGFSLIISYVRAKAESLGVKIEGIGIMERAERILAIAMVMFLFYFGFSSLAFLILLLALVLTIFTAVHRVIFVIGRIK